MQRIRRVLVGAVIGAAGLSPGQVRAAASTIVITGSDRMAPFVRRLAETYTASHPEVKIAVNGGGSSAGIPALLSGSATIAAVARPVTDQELRRARRDLRKQLVGIPIAMDAVVLVVRPDNPTASLTIGQVEEIFTHQVSEWPQLGVDLLESIEEKRARRHEYRHSKGPLINRHMPPETCGAAHVVQSRVLRGKELSLRVDEVLDFIELAERQNDPVDTFSGGMKRRVNIGVGLLHRPQLVHMDEPTVGIDPQSRRRILDTVKQLRDDYGMTVLYTTHLMEEAQELSDRVGIIDYGEIIALGTQGELTQMVGEEDRLVFNVGEQQVRDSLLEQIKNDLPGVTKALYDPPGEEGEDQTQSNNAD